MVSGLPRYIFLDIREVEFAILAESKTGSEKNHYDTIVEMSKQILMTHNET